MSKAAHMGVAGGEKSAALTLDGRPAAGAIGRFSWALFEWARNPYPILVVIYVFAPYFARTLVGNPVRGQTLLGAATATSGVVMAVMAPVVGAIADRTGRRKPWLAAVVLVLIPAATMLWFATPSPGGLGILPTLILLGVCGIAYEFSQVFHNAMLTSVAPAGKVGRLSGLALALGNLAGLLLMSLVLTASHAGTTRGTHLVERSVGPISAAWLALFSLPLFLFTPDEPAGGRTIVAAIRGGLGDLAKTMRGLPRHRPVALFLLARMIFNDGIVGILTFGGVYAAGVFGWPPSTLLLFGIITSGSAVVGGYLGGRLDDGLGPKRTLILALSAVIVLWIVQLSFQPNRIFYVVPVTPGWSVWGSPVFSTLPELLYLLNNQLFGIVLTLTISVSRSMLARLSPPGMTGQFFGLYALSGSATGFLAPSLVAFATALGGTQRAGVAALILLLLAGGAILLTVPFSRGRS